MTVNYERTEPCSGCPFRPGGKVGRINPDRYASMGHMWTCHESFGEWDKDGNFVYKTEPEYQRCAGHVLFMKKTGRRYESRSDKKMAAHLSDPEPQVFNNKQDLIEHYKGQKRG
jgi:hypothetical protein